MEWSAPDGDLGQGPLRGRAAAGPAGPSL